MAYTRAVDLLLVVGLVFLAFMLLALVQFFRFALRFLRDEVEMEPGGSFGRQLLQRDKRDSPSPTGGR
jgi:hypothetical protein